MDDLNKLIARFGNVTEEYKFYNNEITIRYDIKNHKYLLLENGELKEVPSVTQIVHIIDKSNALVPWAVKMMQAKLVRTVNNYSTSIEGWDAYFKQNDLEEWISQAKSAHKEELDTAADIGHIAHGWIERYIKAVINGDKLSPEFPEHPKAASCCMAALDFISRHNIRWICTERKVYSRKWGYAGTLDGMCRADSCTDKHCCPRAFKDRLCLIDWKSSNHLYVEYVLQTAAYQHAWQEENNEKIDDRFIIRLGKDDGEFEPWHFESECFELDFYSFIEALNLTRTTKQIDKRIKDMLELVRQEEKEKNRIEREESLKIKCKGFDRYKGIRKPACNGGNPCKSCTSKYWEMHNGT